MEISPAVQPPKVGDPITAKWAADLAAAVNSCANPADRVGEVSTPFGKASHVPGLPMLGEGGIPAPFECRLFIPAGESATHLFCYIPPNGTGGGARSSPVWVNGWYAAPESGVGSGWVDFGAISTATRYWLVLALKQYTSPDGQYSLGVYYKFALELQSGSGATTPDYPAWAYENAPLVIVASVYIPNGGGAANTQTTGLRQYVRGALNLSAAWEPMGDYRRNCAFTIGDANGALAINLDHSNAYRELVGDWMADGVFNIGNAGEFKYKGATYAPKTISYTDGNGDPQSVTVLAQQ